MLDERHYLEDKIAFPSLLSDEQRRDALRAVEGWEAELTRLSREM
jgi:hypothetical protein